MSKQKKSDNRKFFFGIIIFLFVILFFLIFNFILQFSSSISAQNDDAFYSLFKKTNMNKTVLDVDSISQEFPRYQDLSKSPLFWLSLFIIFVILIIILIFYLILR